MKKNKNKILLGLLYVALFVLVLSSFFNPSEKYIVALFLIISFPFIYKKFGLAKREKIA